MKELLLQAMRNCILHYCKDEEAYYLKFHNKWDEVHTIEQKVSQIAEELTRMGYELKK